MLEALNTFESEGLDAGLKPPTSHLTPEAYVRLSLPLKKPTLWTFFQYSLTGSLSS